MFALLPFVLYLLDRSLQSEMTFAMLHFFVAQPIVKLILLALVGLIYITSALASAMIMDFHYGLDKDGARQSAVTVLVVSLEATALVGSGIRGVLRWQTIILVKTPRGWRGLQLTRLVGAALANSYLMALYTRRLVGLILTASLFL